MLSLFYFPSHRPGDGPPLITPGKTLRVNWGWGLGVRVTSGDWGKGRRDWIDLCKLAPSLHQALLTTAEDGPVEEHSMPLSQVLALEVGLNSKTAVLSSPDTALPGSHLTSLMIGGSLFSF